MAKIILAKTAGFCFGVKRAVQKSQQLAKENATIYSYGELIHNTQEVNRLRALGIVPIENIDDINSGKVIIRTHGTTKENIDILEQKGLFVYDLTCPYVKKIQNIAKTYCQKGYFIVIIGDKVHPEVVGIRGWCANSQVFSTIQDVECFDFSNKLICVLAQTTIDTELFDTICEKIISKCPDAVVHNTICDATSARQTEAMEIARIVDEMYIIGSKHSSNTKKLFEVSKKYCPNTYLVESAAEVKYQGGDIKIGITAGASTPSHIIKEVLKKMEEKTMIHDELSFAEAFEQSLKSLNTGDIVTGIVTQVKDNEIVLDLGFKSDGVIPVSELGDDISSPSDVVKVGDEIEAFVVRVNDIEGQVTLSKRKVDYEKNYAGIVEAFESKETLRGKVVEVKERGVIVSTRGVRVFVPASQSGSFGENLSTLIGKEVPLRIIDLEPRRRKIVASIKAVMREENAKQKEAFWADAVEGKTYTGTVKSVTDFGAFVDIGGVDGLVHVSDLTFKRVKSAKEVVKEGDTLEVFIKSFDKETGKVSLGYKKEEDNPWNKFASKYSDGDSVSGVVVRIVPFGAFVDIDGVDGLVHISELTWKKISHPSEVVKVGQVLECYIKSINTDTKQVALGYKKTEDNPWEIFKTKYHVGDTVNCKIVRLAPFGAFAEIMDGIDGLIHISEITHEKRIATVGEVLKIGQMVDAKIVDIKEDNGRISLSIKALIEPPALKTTEQADAEQTTDEQIAEQVTETEETSEQE